MLEKMFPKNGSKVPEIRFKGFADDWNLYSLQEVATMKARIGWQGLTQKEFLDEGDYYLITGTDFDKGIIDFKNCHFIGEDRYNQDINIQIKNDDVLITKDGTIGKVAYVENMDKPATLNAGVFVIRGKDKNICNLYLYHYLAAPFLLDYADKQATGGTIKHLNSLASYFGADSASVTLYLNTSNNSVSISSNVFISESNIFFPKYGSYSLQE
jgi:type I restriction enzyme S subunit